MKNQYKKIIWLGIFIFLLLFSIFYLIKDIKKNKESISPPVKINPIQSTENNNIILEINSERLETTLEEEKNVYDIMVKLQNEGKISFREKNYPGMGKFIEEINGIKNENKNWIYYVNGEKAQIGVSNYKINKGDLISWKYEKSY